MDLGGLGANRFEMLMEGSVLVNDLVSAAGKFSNLEFLIKRDGGIFRLRNILEEGLYLATKVFKLPLKENVFIIQLGKPLYLLLGKIGGSFTFCQGLCKL